MSVEMRIRLCRLLEKMYSQEMFSKKLGLADTSKYHGKKIHKDKGYLKEEM